MKAKLAETTFPRRSIRMCLSVTPDRATPILNSDLNLWKSLSKGGSSIFIVDSECRDREAQSVGMNFLTKSTLIFLKVRSSALTSGLAHAMSHPLEKDFPLPWSILFRSARILFFSSYRDGFRAKYTFIWSSHRLASSSFPEKFPGSLAFSSGISLSSSGLMGRGSTGSGCSCR